MINKPRKLIFNPNVAKYLLDRGYRIIDITANRENEDKTVFVFEADDEFYELLEEYSQLTREEKEIINK